MGQKGQGSSFKTPDQIFPGSPGERAGDLGTGKGPGNRERGQRFFGDYFLAGLSAP